MGQKSSGEVEAKSKFARSGTSLSQATRTVPSDLGDLIRSNASSGTIPSNIVSHENDFLSRLLSQDATNPEGKDMLNDTIALSPGSYTGSDVMKSMAAVDPYSDTYKEGLGALYDDVFDSAAAAARTGPEAVRGGTVHGAMTEAQLLEKAALDKFREIVNMQQSQAKITTDVINNANAIETSRRGQSLTAQDNLIRQILGTEGAQLGGVQSLDQKRGLNNVNLLSSADILGSKATKTTDNLVGEGLQNSSHQGWSVGAQCCFIFLEALNGDLPWFVRRGRDLMCEPARVRGYKRMARWLVPMMQRYALVKHAVNTVMVRPFLKHGAWFFNDEELARPWYRLYGPICHGWFRVWSWLGRKEN